MPRIVEKPPPQMSSRKTRSPSRSRTIPRISAPSRLRDQSATRVSSPTIKTTPSPIYIAKPKKSESTAIYPDQHLSSSPVGSTASSVRSRSAAIVTGPIIIKTDISRKHSAASLKSPSEKSTRSSAPKVYATPTPMSDFICSICMKANDSISIDEQANDRALRKIMDLEISNTSLLAVNNSLETTIRKQAQTIERLKSQIIHLSGSSRDDADDDDETIECSEEPYEDVSSLPSDQLESPHPLDTSQEQPVLESDSSDTLPPCEPDPAEISYQKICDTIQQLILAAQEAVNINPFVTQPNDGDNCDLKAMDEKFVETLKTKLHTIQTIRNQTNNQNKAIAGVQKPVEVPAPVQSITSSSRGIELPLPLYSQISTLLEDLHVEFVCGQPFKAAEPESTPKPEPKPKPSTATDKATLKKPIVRHDRQRSRTVIESLSQPYLDDPYLKIEREKWNQSPTMMKPRGRGNSPRSTPSPQPGIGRGKKPSGSLREFQYAHPKMQSSDAESTLSSVVGRR